MARVFIQTDHARRLRARGQQTARWGLAIGLLAGLAGPVRAAEAKSLAREVAARGWLVFAAHPAEIRAGRLIADRNGRGQLDLYLARPDGSSLRNMTRTADTHEFGARFAPDGAKLVYRRMDQRRKTNHDHWGAQGTLVIARADGSQPVAYGGDGEYPWATFSPDMRQLACLYKKESAIRIIDVATRKTVREMPSQGIYQQLFWSPDGKKFVGTANVRGRQWSVVCLDLATQRRTLLSRALSCTPDWFQRNSTRVLYSNRNAALFPGKYNNYGLTMLLQATVDGKRRRLIYGNAGKHVYFGCPSPDDTYVVFSDDDRDTLIVGAMHVVRLADTPIIPPALKELKRLYPTAHDGPVLDLKLPNGVPLRGFEPHWTYAEVLAGR